jgi:LmbE family N-acetylglucosaminyl deacetylase
MFSRRKFLQEVGLGTAGFTFAAQTGRPEQVPGRPAARSIDAQLHQPARAMAIAAHPGDAFFAMGSSIALQAQLGAASVFLSLTLGERGSPSMAPAQYGLLQRQAAERAAHLRGAEALFLTYSDGQLPASEEVKLAVCDVIREHQPAAIVTHWKGSWHKDHRACSEIVNDAVFYAGLPALVRSKPPHTVRQLFFAENWEDASGFASDTYVDVSPVFDRWMQACSAFPMWRGETGFRYNDYYRSLAVVRGCLSGFQSAVALMSSPEQLTRELHAL